jgi:hypothetical protein
VGPLIGIFIIGPPPPPFLKSDPYFSFLVGSHLLREEKNCKGKRNREKKTSLKNAMKEREKNIWWGQRRKQLI